MAKKPKPEVTVIKNTQRSVLTLAIQSVFRDDPRLLVQQYLYMTRG